MQIDEGVIVYCINCMKGISLSITTKILWLINRFVGPLLNYYYAADAAHVGSISVCRQWPLLGRWLCGRTMKIASVWGCHWGATLREVSFFTFHFSLFIFHFSMKASEKWKAKWKILKNENSNEKWKSIIELSKFSLIFNYNFLLIFIFGKYYRYVYGNILVLYKFSL